MAFPKIEGYVVTEKLGSGSYSTVYKAYTKVGARSVVAIKCVDKSRLKHSGSAVDNLITEIRLLKTLTHPHIVHMKHFTWDDRNIYIIMEYCCGGDLSKYIHRYGRVPEKQVLYFLQQLASALKFLREKGVVHMDLKPHNLLLHKGSDGKYTLKVADFGFAQYLSDETASCIRGSPLYMAPEMLSRERRAEYGPSVDLWSVGVIMYECLFGKAPYSSSTFKELIEKIQTQAPIEIPRNSSISPGCRELLTRLLQHDPRNRITYEEFFAHEYLDLEHMPSKENYDKAVSLIKQAIDLDSAGNLQGAFGAYCESLRYLVPAVNCEGDAVRRGALRAKLTRYMERAEEIKQYLKSGADVRVADLNSVQPDHQASPRRRVDMGGCCGRDVGSTTSYDFSQIRTGHFNPCVCVNAQSKSDAAVNGECSCGGRGNDGTVTGKEDNIEVPQESPNSSSTTNSGSEKNPGRFGLRRLFNRQGTVPYLDTKDSSITGETGPSEKSKMAVGETSNDVCRIT